MFMIFPTEEKSVNYLDLFYKFETPLVFVFFEDKYCDSCLEYYQNVWVDFTKMSRAYMNYSTIEINCTENSDLCEELHVSTFPSVHYIKQNTRNSINIANSPNISVLQNIVLTEKTNIFQVSDVDELFLTNRSSRCKTYVLFEYKDKDELDLIEMYSKMNETICYGCKTTKYVQMTGYNDKKMKLSVREFKAKLDSYYLNSFIREISVSKLEQIDEQYIQALKRNKEATIVFVINKSDNKSLDDIKSILPDLPPNIRYTYANYTNESAVYSIFKLNDNELPAIVYYNPYTGEIKKEKSCKLSVEILKSWIMTNARSSGSYLRYYIMLTLLLICCFISIKNFIPQTVDQDLKVENL